MSDIMAALFEPWMLIPVCSLGGALALGVAATLAAPWVRKLLDEKKQVGPPEHHQQG